MFKHIIQGGFSVKRLLVLCSSILLIVLFTACGDANSDTNAVEGNSNNDNNESEVSNGTGEISNVVDDEYINATFSNPRHKTGSYYDSYEIDVDIENKTDSIVIVHAVDVTVDGAVELGVGGLGIEVKEKEKRDAQMNPTNEDGELSEEFETIEFEVNVVDYDTFRVLSKHKVKVNK